jgi:hypothetical protein
MVSNLQAVKFPSAIAKADHFADKFVTWSHRSLAIARSMFIAPKKRGSGVALNVAGAHPRAFDFEEHFSRSWLRDGTFLHAVILRAVRHYGWHRFR